MKRFILALAALSMLVLSCTKIIDNPTLDTDPVVTKDIVFNITVTDPGAGDDATRAYIKTGWSNGDEIKIWFGYIWDIENPDLVIKYDGTTWKTVGNKTLDDLELRESDMVWSLYSDKVAVASEDYYIFEDNILDLSIASWEFLTKLQVVVTGTDIDPAHAEDYSLSCDRFSPYTGYEAYYAGIKPKNGDKGAAVTGIANDDGVAFVFADSDLWDESGKYIFSLKYSSNAFRYYAVTTTIQEPYNNTIIKGLKISSSKFVMHEYVDLGLPSGLKWATVNVGATEPEEYGDYYAWGETTTKELYSDTNYTYPYNQEPLPLSNDVANVKWGGTWRMPTDEDWGELIVNCDWVWTDNYNGTGVAGRTVTSKTNGNSIFLPAAGYRGYWGPTNPGFKGNYWSSSPNSGRSNYAWYVLFDSDTFVRDGGGAVSGGQSIRPVLVLESE